MQKKAVWVIAALTNRIYIAKQLRLGTNISNLAIDFPELTSNISQFWERWLSEKRSRICFPYNFTFSIPYFVWRKFILILHGTIYMHIRINVPLDKCFPSQHQTTNYRTCEYTSPWKLKYWLKYPWKNLIFWSYEPYELCHRDNSV